jgi:hypothetical protein
MPNKHEKERRRGDLADRALEPDDHVADASDAGSWASTIGNDERPDPPQPRPHDFSGSDERVERAHALRAGPEKAESADDATGGESWNRALGGNTNAGTLRLLGAIGVFIVIAASLFWLFAD